MPTMNKIDLLDCAAGHHGFSDDASECQVCGLPDLDASMPAPADPVRDAAPDMLAALKLVADSGKFSCFDDSAWDAVNDAIAKAEGAA